MCTVGAASAATSVKHRHLPPVRLQQAAATEDPTPPRSCFLNAASALRNGRAANDTTAARTARRRGCHPSASQGSCAGNRSLPRMRSSVRSGCVRRTGSAKRVPLPRVWPALLLSVWPVQWKWVQWPHSMSSARLRSASASAWPRSAVQSANTHRRQCRSPAAPRARGRTRCRKVRQPRRGALAWSERARGASPVPRTAVLPRPFPDRTKSTRRAAGVRRRVGTPRCARIPRHRRTPSARSRNRAPRSSKPTTAALIPGIAGTAPSPANGGGAQHRHRHRGATTVYSLPRNNRLESKWSSNTTDRTMDAHPRTTPWLAPRGSIIARTAAFSPDAARHAGAFAVRSTSLQRHGVHAGRGVLPRLACGGLLNARSVRKYLLKTDSSPGPVSYWPLCESIAQSLPIQSQPEARTWHRAQARSPSIARDLAPRRRGYLRRTCY